MPDRLSEKDNVRKPFLEKPELDGLATDLPEPLDDMAQFGFATGWRRGELLSLTWAAVWKDEIRLGTTKNGQPRSLPLDVELKELIERRRKAREYVTRTSVGLSAYVFHRKGNPITRTLFRQQCRTASLNSV